ncbi:MAG: sigma-70 family RNA polymerase sigma factor [Acidimicrobiia bacterium]
MGNVDPAELPAHLDDLYRYALSLTRDRDRAADLVQDTVLRAMERGHQFRNDAPLGHWLTVIAHRLAIDQGRRSSREIPMEESEADWRDDSFSVDAVAVVERAATRAELEDALARLPFIYRSAVVLHDVKGLRVADIAEIHEIGLSAAKQRLRRGRMALVRALASGHERHLATKGVPLRCWDARQHVSDFLDGDLAPELAAAVEQHLSGCPTCPPLYAHSWVCTTSWASCAIPTPSSRPTSAPASPPRSTGPPDPAAAQALTGLGCGDGRLRACVPGAGGAGHPRAGDGDW